MANRLRTRASLVATLALMLGLVLAGCLAPTQGDVAVYVRADPHNDFTEITLTFTRVEVQRAGAQIQDGPDEGVDRGAGDDAQPAQRGIVALSTESIQVDLLQFTGPDSRALLGFEEAREGQYHNIILRLGEAHGVLRDDGSQVEFNVRSPEVRQSHEFIVIAEQTTRVTLEFDLEASISQTDEGEWRLSPQVANVRHQENAAGDEGDVPDRGA